MNDLVLLDLKILLGADIPWSHSGKQPDAPSDLAAAALSQARRGDDDSVSSKDDAAAPDANGSGCSGSGSSGSGSSSGAGSG